MLRRVTFVAALLGVAIFWPASGAGAAQEVGQSPSPARKPDVWFVPTPHDVVQKMLELAGVKPPDVVYDLGCGDGRIVIAAARKYGCKAVGIELDPKLAEQSRAGAREARVEHLVRIEQKDLFSVDLSDADVVTLYLLVDLNAKLVPQLEKLKPGSRIVSNAFPIVGVQADKVVVVKSPTRSQPCTLYLYTTPLKKSRAKSLAPATSEKPALLPVPRKEPDAGKPRLRAFTLIEAAGYQEAAVLSRTLVGKSGGCVKLLAMDRQEELTEQATAFESLIYVVEGELRLTVFADSAEDYTLRAGQSIIVPANTAQAAKAVSRVKLLLVMIRP